MYILFFVLCSRRAKLGDKFYKLTCNKKDQIAPKNKVKVMKFNKKVIMKPD